jgi:hypothetical protein
MKAVLRPPSKGQTLPRLPRTGRGLNTLEERVLATPLQALPTALANSALDPDRPKSRPANLAGREDALGCLERYVPQPIERHAVGIPLANATYLVTLTRSTQGVSG